MLSLLRNLNFLVFAFCSQGVPLVWNIEFLNDDFVGRTSEFQEVDRFINHQKHSVVAITGLSGSGKTYLAKFYLVQNKDRYDVVWVFNAKQNLKDQYYQLALMWNEAFPKESIPLARLSGEAIVDHMKNTLRKTPKTWCLIFDDAVSFEEISTFLPHVHEKVTKHVLVTSQNKTSWHHQVHLGLFSEAEALKFLQIHFDEKSDSLKDILKITGLYPLSLKQTAAYIRANNLSLENYQKLYQEAQNNHQDLLGMEFSMKAAIRMALKKLDSAPALDVLRFIAHLKSERIPEVWIQTFLRLFHPQITGVDVMNRLRHFSLMEEHTHQGKKEMLMHDQVADIVLEDVMSKKDLILKEVAVMNAILPKKWYDLAILAQKDPLLFSEAERIWREAAPFKTEDVFELGVTLLEYHIYKTRDHPTYEALTQQLMQMEKSIDPTRIPVTMARYRMDRVYARGTYFSEVDAKEVEDHLQKAIDFFEYDPEELTRAQFNRAQFHLFRGHIDQALSWILRAEETLQKVQNLSVKSLFCYVKAWILFEKGDYQNAITVLKTFFSWLPEEQNYAIRLYGMSMMANVLFEIGDFEGALSSADQALSEAVTFYNTEMNETTAEASLLKSRILLKMGRKKDAEEIAQKSMVLYERYFGKEKHADQAYALQILGEIYTAQNRDQEAYAVGLQAEKLYQQLYGEESVSQHVSDLTRNLAILGAKLKDDEITHTYLKKHIKTFGLDHPGTVAIVAYLDQHNLPIPL